MRRRRILLVGIGAGALAVFLSIILLRPKPEVLYQVVFLPSLGSGLPLTPCAINDQGQVVGMAEVTPGQWHLFLWDERGSMRDLGLCADPRRFECVLINNAGQIAGTAVDPNGDCQAFLQDPNGLRHILFAPVGQQVYILGLNNRGQVVGYHGAQRGPRRAFVWDKTTGMQDLAPANAIESLARSINDAGQVVGFLSVDRTNDRYAFLWDPNTGMKNLGPARSLPTATCHINNRGLVVGQFGSAEDGTCISIWTKEGGAQRLHSRGASMHVAGVDDEGRFVARAYWSGHKVLGYDFSDRYTSYLWNPKGRLTEIHRHLGRRDIVEFLAVDTNNKGQIVGLLRLERQPSPFSVVLEPVR